MADNKLTTEQKQNLVKRLAFLNKISCQSCGSKDWIASENIFEMREFSGGNLVIGGKSAILPVIPVTCKQCGQTIFFNALAIGILSQGEKDEQK